MERQKTCALEFWGISFWLWNGKEKCLNWRWEVRYCQSIPLHEQGDSVLILHPLVPWHLPVKWKLLNFPLNTKFYHVYKFRDPSGKSKAFHPICLNVPSKSATGGILWSSLELEQGRGYWGKGSSPSSRPSVMATAKVGAGLLHSPPYFAFENLSPSKKSLMFYPARPKFECVLLHGCPGDDRSLCAMAVQQWHSTQLTVPQLLGHTEPEQGAPNHELSLTSLPCQVPVSASMFPTQGPGQPWQGVLGSDRALWFKSQWDTAPAVLALGKNEFSDRPGCWQILEQPTKE